MLFRSVGMSKTVEVGVNIRLFHGEDIPEAKLAELRVGKSLFIARFCTGCGSCVAMCPNEALTLIQNKAVVEKNKCILCGYCNPVCPEFALRLV